MVEPQPSERQLYADLATAVARALPWSVDIEDWDPTQGFAGDLFDHEFMSAFERAAEVLLKLSVIEAVEANGRGLSVWRLRMDVQAIAAHVLARKTSGPPLAHLLLAFLMVCDQRGIMPTGSDAFTPPYAYLDLMKALAEVGYADAAGDMFIWTEKSRAIKRAGIG